MQLDYRQYQSKLRQICTVKPNTEHVDNFIRAFYLQDEEVEAWLRENAKLYTVKQLTNVVMVSSTKLPQKERKRLVKVIGGELS